MDERRAIFETVPVPRAVAKLAVPTIISQLITMIYSLADTLFVGMMDDPAQVAAVTLAWPAFMLLTVLANLFGIGGGSYISRLLGVRRDDEVASVASFCFYFALCVTLAYALVVLFFCETISGWFGADEENLKFTCDYLKWVICVGAIPTVGNMLLAHLVRAEGASKAAGFGLSMGGVLNIILDPIFIMPWGLNLQVVGAAMATAISNTVAFIFFLGYITVAKETRVISLRLSEFRFCNETIRNVLKIGLPAALQTLLAAVSNAVLNSLAAAGARAVGTASASSAVAAIGIAKKVDMLPMNIAIGMSQGVLPLLSYTYAAKDHGRMHAAERCAMKVIISIAVLWILVIELFSKGIITLFIREPQTVEYGVRFIRILCIATPFLGVGYMLTSAFQAAGCGKKAFFMSLLRKGPIDITLMYIANSIVPLFGLPYVQPVVDAVAAVISVIMYREFMKTLRGTPSDPADDRPH